MSSKFSDFLAQNLPKAPSFHPHYEEALGYTLKAGGKHFRANLLLGVVDALRPDLVVSAMRVALGVECLHAYSLIHDDLPVMDDSPLRRGQPSLHEKYGETTAILVGDALNTHAFFLIATADFDARIRTKCVEILAQNGGAAGMVLGQAIDCFFEGEVLGLDQLRFLHLHKTGKLIAASLKMGAVIADASEKEADKLYQIGLDLGLAFQIHDDIIDASGDAAQAGKPVQNDTVKNSFTNLLGLAGAKQERDSLIAKIRAELASEPKILNFIDGLIKRHLV